LPIYEINLLVSKEMKIINFIAMSFLMIGCKASNPPLETVPEVDLKRYVGVWYEIAAFPQYFEKGCTCTSAEYQPTDKNYIKVINKCQKSGKLSKAVGKAFIVPNSGNAKLKVQFFWPFRGNYWIIELDPEYQWAVVGEASRKYLWILARNQFLDENIYNDLLKRISNKGFDISKIQITKHNCK
jgi:apolipoprotein D and lipocalin family protein